MAYNISVGPRIKEKNDELWGEIVSGALEEKLRSQIDALQHELESLRGKAYSGSKRLILGHQIKRLTNLADEIAKLMEYKTAKNVPALTTAIPALDRQLPELYDADDVFFFSEPHAIIHPFFNALFTVILGIDVTKDPGYQGTLSLIPKEKWLELYQGLTIDAVQRAMKIAGQKPTSNEQLKHYVNFTKDIRFILKHCIETNSELFMFDEAYAAKGGYQKRVQEIMSKFFAA